MIWFTADNHFSHTNIIRFCDRPFQDVHTMNTEMVVRWNRIVNDEDDVFVLGDFRFREYGMATGEILRLLKGNIYLIRGNHDRNNNVRTNIDEMVIEWWGKKILLIHDPAYAYDRADKYDLILCGHVHKHWKFRMPNIVNVGVDVWDFQPVQVKLILREFNRWKNMEGVEWKNRFI